MSTTIDALRELGEKVNGTKPISNYTGNIINEIADNYTGGGSGSGIYVFDFTDAEYDEVDDYTATLTKSITANQKTELEAQPAINLTIAPGIHIFGNNSVTVTKGYLGYEGGGFVDPSDNRIVTLYLQLSSSVAVLTIRSSAMGGGGGGLPVYDLGSINCNIDQTSDGGMYLTNRAIYTISEALYNQIAANPLGIAKVSIVPYMDDEPVSGALPFYFTYNMAWDYGTTYYVYGMGGYSTMTSLEHYVGSVRITDSNPESTPSYDVTVEVLIGAQDLAHYLNPGN